MGVRGTRRVRGVEVMSLTSSEGDQVRGPVRSITCDLVAVSGGWSPVVHLHSQSGGRVRWDEEKACIVPDRAVQSERTVGAANGTFATGHCLAEGFKAGRDAAAACGFVNPTASEPPAAADPAQEPLRPLWLVPSRHRKGHGPKQFVDPQNDVTAADILLAVREGYHSVEHVKRYTALGFGTDQGKVGNINGMAILAGALGKDISKIGTTTFRPNYTPGEFRGHGRPRCGRRAVRPGPTHGAAPVARGEWSRVRGGRPVDASEILPAAWRVNGRCRESRVQRSA